MELSLESLHANSAHLQKDISAGTEGLKIVGVYSTLVVELLLVEIELGREIVNYTSKNNVS